MPTVNTALRAALCLSLTAVLAAPTLAQRTSSKSGRTTWDTTPPVLTLPASMRVEATSSAGATVSFAVSASDNVDRKVSVSCNPASGTGFTLGSNSVICEARDSAGNRVTGSFTVGVFDTVAPTIGLPGTVTAEAVDSGGVPVSFAVSASDRVDAKAAAQCTPASGSVFAPGTTSVSCGAADFSGNRSSGRFDVTVSVAAPVAVASSTTAPATTTTSTASEPAPTTTSTTTTPTTTTTALTTTSTTTSPTTTSTSTTTPSTTTTTAASTTTPSTTTTTAAATTTTQAAVSGSAALSWSAPTTRSDGQPLSMSELAGYEIYMLAESTGVSSVITLSDPFSTSRSIDGLTPDIYHFAISAIDSSGLVSALSPLVSKTVP